MEKLKVYTAGPFFNPDQVDTCEKVERILDRYHYKKFSPRLNGGVFNKDASLEEREQQAKDIFTSNENAMSSCDFAVINIDDRDTGTAWEFGYFYGKGIPCVSYSKHGYGSNIMLSQSGLAHFPDLTSLRLFLMKLSMLYNEQPEDIELQRAEVRNLMEAVIQGVEVELSTRFRGLSDE